jgi:hypothetical protein
MVTTRKKSHLPAILTAIILLVCAAAGYRYWQNTLAPSAPVMNSDTLLPVEPVTPLIPVATPDLPTANAAETTPLQPEQIKVSEPPLTPSVDQAPLPLLDESDAAIKNEISSIVASALREPLSVRWLGDNLLRRFVTFVANIAEGKLDTKSSPLLPPKTRFAVSSSVPPVMTEDSHARFNTHIQIVTSISPATCAATYRRYYPLLQGAYADLGEKKTFHSVLLTAIDLVIAAPEPEDEPLLVAADKGLLKFADPKLEALPAAQKPLLRMGRDNATQLKQWLRQFRAAVLATPTNSESTSVPVTMPSQASD